MRPHFRATSAFLLAAGALALAACGDDDEDKGTSGGTGAAKTMKVSVSAQNRLTGVTSVPAGAVKIDFTNQSRQGHDLQVIRVDGNQTAQDVLKVIGREGGPIPPWMHGAGGVGSVEPGQTGTSTQVLRPGRYHVIASADAEGEGPPPLTAPLEVRPGESEGSLPSTDARIEAFDYGFRQTGLKSGDNTITFANRGRELHHVVAAPIQPGKTIADVRRFAATQGEPSGPPPLDFESGFDTVVLDGGASQTTTIELRPGKYAFLCFIQDRAGGPPHVAKGMIQEVTVPR